MMVATAIPPPMQSVMSAVAKAAPLELVERGASSMAPVAAER